MVDATVIASFCPKRPSLITRRALGWLVFWSSTLYNIYSSFQANVLRSSNVFGSISNRARLTRLTLTRRLDLPRFASTLKLYNTNKISSIMSNNTLPECCSSSTLARVLTKSDRILLNSWPSRRPANSFELFLARLILSNAGFGCFSRKLAQFLQEGYPRSVLHGYSCRIMI